MSAGGNPTLDGPTSTVEGFFERLLQPPPIDREQLIIPQHLAARFRAFNGGRYVLTDGRPSLKTAANES